MGLLIGALILGFIIPDPYPPSSIPRNVEPNFQLMAEAWNAIEKHFVDRPNIKRLTMTYGAIWAWWIPWETPGTAAF